MKARILLPIMFVACVSVPACNLLDTVTNSTGKEVTKLEAVLDKAHEGINTVAPVANMFAPGAGTIAGGVGMLLSLIGGLTTSIVVAKRRGGALEAVIKGVQLADDEDTKNKIKAVSGALGIEPYLNKIYKGYFPKKT